MIKYIFPLMLLLGGCVVQPVIYNPPTVRYYDPPVVYSPQFQERMYYGFPQGYSYRPPVRPYRYNLNRHYRYYH